VQTTYQPHWAETHRHWHDTLQNLGIDTNHAHFGGSNVGAWTSLVNVDPRTQTRSYSAAAYLRPALNRPNLKVLTGGRAERILLQRKEDQGQGGRGVGINTEPTAPDLVATGVSFFANGRSLTARCRREVVLSAGSVGSPQLLELSGIGNPRILERAGIEVKVANPNVGENLQEHMSESCSHIHENSALFSTNIPPRSDHDRL
jgi:choline dehydrogenase-like flavoprotein